MSAIPSPRLAVTSELVSALGEAALTPLRAWAFLVATRRAQAAEIARDLSAEVEVDEPEALDPARFPDRPLRVFLSCAEASGELHALSLLAELRAACAAAGAPEPEVFGLGGERLAAAGVECVGDPVSRAAMGFEGVLGELPFYLRILHASAVALGEREPDVCVPVDSPALHVPLGRLAHRANVPVVHFVTPQYWGWAPWRVDRYRSAVDLALTILPFEVPWFERRHVPTAHVGHPILDALEGVPSTRPSDESRELVVLPGSRAKVVERNLPWMLDVLERLRHRHRDLRVVLPHARPELGSLLERHVTPERADWVRVETGDLHACLARARAAFSVSGTVLLDLLHHRLPTVVIYRLGSPTRRAALYGKLLTDALVLASIEPARRRARSCPEFGFAGRRARSDAGPWTSSTRLLDRPRSARAARRR